MSKPKGIVIDKELLARQMELSDNDTVKDGLHFLLRMLSPPGPQLEARAQLMEDEEPDHIQVHVSLNETEEPNYLITHRKFDLDWVPVIHNVLVKEGEAQRYYDEIKEWFDHKLKNIRRDLLDRKF